MLDINFIRENVDLVKQAVHNKKIKEKVDVDEIIRLYDELKGIEQELVAMRTKRNELTDAIKSAKDDNERTGLIDQATVLKGKMHGLEEKMKTIGEKFAPLMLLVPNVTSPKMPVGKDDSGNVAIRKWGQPRKFDFEVKDHVDLGKTLDLIEIEKAGKISGSRFYYLKNEAVLIQFAIIQFVLKTLMDESVLKDIAVKVGNPFSTPFKPIVPPVMIKPQIMKKMDRLDPIEERYVLPADELVLVGSAEHTLGPLHMDEIFEEKDLPVRYIGYSTAFRREAGSYGKDVRGILRVHQFDKLEMETYVPAEFGEVEQEFIVALQEYMLQELEIPYQVVQICTGDTGKPDYNQYDIECWIPSQDKYRETHTSDYMTDFQARRLNIKYRGKDGKNKFVQMNDATAFAIGRILIAILENNQQADGSVKIPQVLVPFVGKDVINTQKASRESTK